MKRTVLIILSLLLILTVFGCSAKNAAPQAYYGGTYDSSYAYAEEAVEAPAEYEAPSSALGNDVNTASAALPANRKIIRNADLSVQTLEFDAFLNSLNTQIASFGGYVESSSVGGRTYYNQSKLRTARLVIRIPADQLDAFLNVVNGLGNVTSVNTGMRDVTTNYIDSEKHLEALRTEQEALLEILKSAVTVEDIITVQDRLSYVRYEIESYESILRSYDDQVDMSSVTLNIDEVERETIVEPETFGQEVGRRFKESLEDVGEFFRDLTAWLIGNAPQIFVFLLFNGVIVLIIVLSVRRGIKRRAKRRAAKAAKQAQQNEQQPQA